MTSERAPDDVAAPVSFSGATTSRHPRLALWGAILASAMAFADSTVVAIALPKMRLTLGAGLLEVQWFHNAYMLNLTAFILLGGALGDRLGLARVFRLGIVLFLAASLACAFAPTALSLIAARTLQGLGAAIMVPGSLALISTIFPDADRSRAIGVWAAASAMTTALGPILGGLALSFGGPETWRIVFAVNLPLGLCALWFLHHAGLEDRPRTETGLDLVGACLATASLAALAWGLSVGALHVLAAGTLLLGAFLWHQGKTNAPMMPLSLFANRTFSATNIMSFTLYGALSIIFFFLPMTLIAALDLSEIDASAAFAPMSVFIAALSGRAGRLSDRFGPRVLLVSGCVLVAIGYLTLALVFPTQLYWSRILPAMCLVGLGMSAVVAPLSATLMASVSDGHSGVGSAINNALTRLAGLIFVAALGPVVTLSYGQFGGTQSFGVLAQDPAHKAAMIQTFVLLSCVASSLALCGAICAALFIPTRPKPGPQTA